MGWPSEPNKRDMESLEAVRASTFKNGRRTGEGIRAEGLTFISTKCHEYVGFDEREEKINTEVRKRERTPSTGKNSGEPG